VATYLGEIARMAPEYFCLCELVKFRNFGGSSEGPVFCHTPRCMISGMSAVLTRPALRAVPARAVAITPSLGMSFSVFAQLSESVAAAARHVGLVPPGFQSLSTGISRRLVRRTPAGPIIAVKVRGRSTGSVLIDLVEGVLAVAPDSGEANARLAQEMYAFLGAEGWPIVEDRETEPNSNVVGVQAA
jgi:hypothetical protein